MPTEGTLSLYINADKARERKIKNPAREVLYRRRGALRRQGRSRACHRRLPRRSWPRSHATDGCGRGGPRLGAPQAAFIQGPTVAVRPARSSSPTSSLTM
jgi:hypothetical protein